MSRKITLCVICCCIILSANYVFADTTANIEQAKTAIKSSIAAGKDANAAYQKLIADFAGNASISVAAYDIAEAYRDNKKYERSRQVYKDVVSKWPNGRQAIWAQRGVAVSNIAMDKLTDAQADTDKLLKQYAGDPEIAAAVTDIGGAYHWFKKYPQADAINELVLKKWPDSEPALWARMNLVTSKIAAGKFTEAAKGVGILASSYPNDKRITEALGCIEGSYEYNKKYDEAKRVFGDIINKNANSAVAAEARFIVDKIKIFEFFEQGDAESTIAAANDLAAKYSNNAGLTWALSRQTAEDRFYVKAFELREQGQEDKAKDYFNKAITIWLNVVDLSQASTEKPYAVNWIGDCYRQVGDFEKSAQFYEKAVNDYPDFELTWHSLYMVGWNYEKLKEAGQVDKGTADSRIRAVYTQLLEKHPDCKASQAAKSWLDRNTATKPILSVIRSR